MFFRGVSHSDISCRPCWFVSIHHWNQLCWTSLHEFVSNHLFNYLLVCFCVHRPIPGYLCWFTITDNNKQIILLMLATANHGYSAWFFHAPDDKKATVSQVGPWFFFFPFLSKNIMWYARPYAVSHAEQERVIEAVISECTSQPPLRTTCQRKGGWNLSNYRSSLTSFHSRRNSSFILALLDISVNRVKFTPYLLPFFSSKLEVAFSHVSDFFKDSKVSGLYGLTWACSWQSIKTTQWFAFA